MMEIGICSWSIDRHDLLRAIEIAGNVLEVSAIHIGLFSESALENAKPSVFRAAADKANVRLVAGFIGFEGEDYSSIETLASTGGYLPDGQFRQRLAMTRQAAKLMSDMGCGRLAVHLGTVPAGKDNPNYPTLVERVRSAADSANEHNVRLLLETGREPATVLADFISEVQRPNVGVNFDTANFITFATDQPAKALTRLLPLIEVVHLKDSTASPEPGRLLGQYAPLGSGDAKVARVVNKIRLSDFTGPLLVERGSGTGEIDELRAALDYVRSLLT